jgi:16S rRNA (cytosine967-C5)-methyltransferase
VTTLEGYAEGHFVVQDAATRHAIQLMDVRPGMRVLDACAAPGGKTVQLATRLGSGDLLIANEFSAGRLETLRDTLTRCAVKARVDLQQADATTATFGSFDAILLDVPCSNTGVFGRRPDARWSWTPQKLNQLLETQRALLNNCARQVLPGGKLVYSTCSIEPDENERQIEAFLSRHPEFQQGETRLELPSENHDGAFACVLLRRA